MQKASSKLCLCRNILTFALKNVCSEKLEDFDESCFSAGLDPYYHTQIDEFRDAYLALNLPFTTKVRILSYNGSVRKGR